MEFLNAINPDKFNLEEGEVSIWYNIIYGISSMFLVHKAPTEGLNGPIVHYIKCLLSPLSFQINLRKYVLNGGIYEFNFMQKPRQTNFPNLTMTWLEIPAVLKYKNRNCYIKDVDFKSIGIEQNRERAGADAEEDFPDIKKQEEPSYYMHRDDESFLTFFIITFKVPAEICRWQIPTVCQWYEVSKAMDGTSDPPPINRDLDVRTPVIINDFILSRTLEIPMVFHIINHLIPRFTSVHQFPEELQKNTGTKKKFAIDEIEIGGKEEKKEEPIVKIPADRLFPIFQAVKPVVIVPMVEGTLTEKGIKDQTIKLFSDYVHDLEKIKFSKMPRFKPEPKKKKKKIESEGDEASLANTPSASEVKYEKVKEKKSKKAKGSHKKSLKKADVIKVVNFIKSLSNNESEEENEDHNSDQGTTEGPADSDKESVDSKLDCRE